MSNLSEDWSDHGECIANADDYLDSEIIAKLVNERLLLLSDKDVDALVCVYGQCFRQKMTVKEYADKNGITPSSVRGRLRRATYIFMRPGTKMMKYLEQDDYYKKLIRLNKKEKGIPAPIDELKQRKIETKYECERQEYIKQLLEEEDRFYPVSPDRSLAHFRKVVRELKRKSNRK